MALGTKAFSLSICNYTFKDCAWGNLMCSGQMSLFIKSYLFLNKLPGRPGKFFSDLFQCQKIRFLGITILKISSWNYLDFLSQYRLKISYLTSLSSTHTKLNLKELNSDSRVYPKLIESLWFIWIQYNPE